MLDNKTVPMLSLTLYMYTIIYVSQQNNSAALIPKNLLALVHREMVLGRCSSGGIPFLIGIDFQVAVPEKEIGGRF